MICKNWMEVGDKFVFATRHWKGREVTLPAHPDCVSPLITRTQLNALVARAEREGFVSAYDRGDLYEI